MRTKLALLNTLNGLWILALLAAVCFFVAALLAYGSWSTFLWALGIGAVAKWFASVSRDRLAKLSAKSGASSTDLRDADDIVRSNAEAAKRRRDIIASFIDHVKRCPDNGDIRDVSELPYQKEEILDAFVLEIVREDDPNRRDSMAQRLQSLSYYQEGIGSNPVRQIGMSVGEMDHFSLELAKAKSDQEISAIAETMAKTISSSPEPDHYQELWPLVRNDLLNIFSRTQIATALSRTMPAEKKRGVLG